MRGTNLYGIEPSAEAASFAETVGINIIGTSVSGFSAEAHKFDLILMTDVFEHIVSSTDVIARLTSSLRPNGRLVIVTGAYDSPTFSFWKSKYYYSAMPEHVVFITKGYAEWCARRLGLNLINYRVIGNRDRTFPPAALKAFIKGVSSLLLNLLPTNWFAGKRQNWVQKLRAIRGYGMPNIFSKPDHALVIFEKIIPSQK
jgi:SAM-dependent methyltransferase